MTAATTSSHDHRSDPNSLQGNSGDQFPRSTQGVNDAEPTEVLEFKDGDRFDLRIAPVTKQLGPSLVRMLAYNGSIPGPTLLVRQGSELVVHVTNDGDLEGTVHWHGLRLENRFDGTPETQKPMAPGDAFTYRLTFPDPGVYWYHPHIREDYSQEMGLYGNIVVIPSDPDYWPKADREVTLTLDDILVENDGIAPFHRSHSNYTAMGRFGNVLLANGESDLALRAQKGEVVRFYLTNTANARTFNVGIPGAVMKLVGGDSGRYEQERIVERVLLAPSERAVVDVLFETSGRVDLDHRTPERTYVLANIVVQGTQADSTSAQQFYDLRTNPDLAEDRRRASRWLKAEPDKSLSLIAEMDIDEPEVPEGMSRTYVSPMHPEVTAGESGRCPKCGMKLIPAASAGAPDHAHHHGEVSQDSASRDEDVPEGIEWEDDMVDVNRTTTPSNMHWKLVDRETGAEGSAITWRFRVGDQVKIRLVNEMDSDHPMQHPFHIHGAGRFLVLSRNGVADQNAVWKDTVLVRKGETVDVLFDVTNPGSWMAHCHIAEHHEGGMMFTFHVKP